MSAGIFDWASAQGATNVHFITVLEKDDDGNEQPLDLTGFTFQMQVRKKAESPIIILEASSALGNITVVGAVADGKIAVEFTAEELSAIDARKYVYDLEYTAPSNAIARILQGSFLVDAEVTQ
jgi:hypothetical protein